MKYSVVFILFFSAILCSCSNVKENRQICLSGEWQFRQSGDTLWHPASVPGCVHTDLLENGLIPDPFYRKNEQLVKWVEEKDWEYIYSFDLQGDITSFSNIILQFEGLDTYSDVFLNDSLVLQTDNMFIAWEVPVKKLVRKGKNTLKVNFKSASRIGMEKLRNLPYTLMAANELAPENERTNVFTRKAPFHYGWDWGPRLVTCGIWKPVNIIAWDLVRPGDLYVKPMKISKEKASYTAVVELRSVDKTKITYNLLIDGNIMEKGSVNLMKGDNRVNIDFAIENPEFWWTNGLGGHRLYKVEFKIMNGDKPIQTISKRVGVRTLELVQENDSIGKSFMFRLNGVPVFMKGANYIPSDIFLTRNTIENYKRVVSDAVSANMNMLRIWGGAVYESDELYDLLDENGILAWNDFMFACNVQPADSLHLENIRKEAEYNVKRLRNHPSIALWCGNNENLTAWFSWKWNQRYSDTVADTLWKTYQKIYYEILPEAVRKYHPEVAYWPSSPQTSDNKLADRLSGDEHDWTVWFGDVPFSSYSQKVARFVSEYGMQSFPEMKTVRAFADSSDMTLHSEIMDHRQRSQMPWIAPGFNGNEMIKKYISRYYRMPADFESFVYLSQVMQAEGVRYAIETHRRNMPWCMGSLYWQINDCWPTMSWAGVDYFGRWKAMHYFVKKAFRPVYPVVYREGKNINVSVVSDKLIDTGISLEMKCYDFRGKVLWEKIIDTTLTANSGRIYFSIPESRLLKTGSERQMVFEARVMEKDQVLAENLFYFRDCKDLALENPGIKTTVSKTGEQEYEITLTAEKLAKNVALFTDSSEGFFSDNYFDLIPGRAYKIKYSGASQDLSSEIEIKCVNNL